VPNIFDLAEEFRTALDKNDRQASNRMVRSYGGVYSRLRQDIDTVAVQLLEMGVTDPRRLGLEARRDRLGVLLSDTKTELTRFAGSVSEQVYKEQESAIRAALAHSRRMMGVAVFDADTPTVMARFQGLPTEAFTDLVGFTQAGSPLYELFASIPLVGVDALERSMLEGVALGRNARAIAAEAKKALALPLTRTLTIARTETLRAYRESTRRGYEANGHLIEGWQWFSARDRRSCAACWAMHGTKHTAQERLDGHPNCRCSMIPWVKGRDPFAATADAEFAKLSERDQRFILGRERFGLWKDGRVTLDDLVVRTDDPRWGSMRRAANTKEALAMAAKRKRGQVVDRDKASTEEVQKKPRQSGLDPLAEVKELLWNRDAATPQDLIRAGERVDAEIRKRTVKILDQGAVLGEKATKLTQQIDDLIERMRAQPNDAAGNDEYDRLYAQKRKLAAARERIENQFYKLNPDSARRDAAKSVLAELRPLGGKLEFGPGGESFAMGKGVKEKAKLIQKQMEFLPSEWVQASNNLGRLGVEYQPPTQKDKDKLRAHYSPRQQGPYIRLAYFDKDDVAIHEFGHRVEHAVPRVKAAEKAFYEYRTAGEPLTKLADAFPGSSYKSNEVYRKDRFLEPYQGKDYGGAFYELLTMGLQQFYHPSPAYPMDDEMKHWVLGVLAAL
jgi:SPP1 gp7 family putative phage head morphogenesis protein